MGTCALQSDLLDPTISSRKFLNQFELVNPIGQGGYGLVWKVYHKRTQTFYAMKQMEKLLVLSRNNLRGILNEFRILSMLRHPLITNMHYAFQDKEKVYLVLDFMTNKDLRCHITKKVFSEKETKFIIACIMSGLRYLHYNGVIHGDIKPENLTVDDHGYIHISDFGAARLDTEDTTCETTGTPGYMAPEILFRRQHNFSVDYFSVGVIIFELMMKKRPFRNSDRGKLREEILNDNQSYIDKTQIPEGWSEEVVTLVNGLLTIDPAGRLGAYGPKEVQNHPWFADIDWEKLEKQELQAPFVPDTPRFPKMSDIVVGKKNPAISQGAQQLFTGFFYDRTL